MDADVPDDPAVERAVRAWFRQPPKEFFAAGFQGPVKRWDKCLNLYGDYVEKKSCLYVIISIRLFSITICNLLIEFPSYNFRKKRTFVIAKGRRKFGRLIVDGKKRFKIAEHSKDQVAANSLVVRRKR